MDTEIPLLQIGDVFPTIHGRYLSGRLGTVPQELTGQWAFIIIGYSDTGRSAKTSWMDLLLDRYGDEPWFNLVELRMMEVNPRLGEVVNKGLRDDLPDDAHPRLLTYYGVMDHFHAMFGREAKDDVHCFFIDPQGTIIWKSGGWFDPEDFKRLLPILKDRFQ